MCFRQRCHAVGLTRHPNQHVSVLPRRPYIARHVQHHSISRAAAAESAGVQQQDSAASPHIAATNGTPKAPQLHPSGPVGEAWGSQGSAEEDWSGGRPFSWKDVDWGFAALLGIILGLSIGAFRLLSHFRVYATQHVRPTPVVTLDTRRSQRSKQQPSTSSSSTAATQQQEGLSGAAGTKAAADDKASSGPSAAGSRDGAAAAAGPASATSSRADRAGPMPVSSSSAGLQPGLIPAVGSPGGPQPSPADLQQAWQGLPEGSAPTPAAAAGALGLPALGLLPDMPGGLPALPTMQAELPRQGVTPGEVAALPLDYSVPSLRERAHLAMRASAAAMESSQRAAAYSAAASSAASRAAEAAEQSAAAAASVQSALEHAAEDAMASALERMNRAVEMVADAESRAAAAAAMATAHQDLAEGQAAAAVQAADLPAPPAASGSESQGHVADIHKVLHQKLFSFGSLLQEVKDGLVAAVVGLLAALQAALLGAGAAVQRGLAGVFGFAKPF